MVRKGYYCLLINILMVFYGCATIPKNEPFEYAADPNLPKPEQVEIIGKLAIQKWGLLDPKILPYSSKTNELTSAWIATAFTLPPEELLKNPLIYETTLYSLAHQWALTQITTDYLQQYEDYLHAQKENRIQAQRNLEVSNFFLGLAAIGNAVSASMTRDTVIMSNNSVAILSREQSRAMNRDAVNQSMNYMMQNQLLSEYYGEQNNDLDTILIKTNLLKSAYLSYSNLLTTYKEWLFNAVTKSSKKEIPSDAMEVFQIKSPVIENAPAEAFPTNVSGEWEGNWKSAGTRTGGVIGNFTQEKGEFRGTVGFTGTICSREPLLKGVIKSGAILGNMATTGHLSAGICTIKFTGKFSESLFEGSYISSTSQGSDWGTFRMQKN